MRDDIDAAKEREEPHRTENGRLTLGSYGRYEDAQRTVDSLADRGFPVQNVAIVAGDLRVVEQVTGP